MSGSPRILVFKAQALKEPSKPTKIQLVRWRPSLGSLQPPRKPGKYALYSLFHYSGVFGSSLFQQVTATIDGQTVGSLLIVPAYFKYAFMARSDVQITYVMVDPVYRGQGIGLQMMYDAMRDIRSGIWYVTDESNLPSISLATKAGFELAGFAQRSGRVFKRLKLQ